MEVLGLHLLTLFPFLAWSIVTFFFSDMEESINIFILNRRIKWNYQTQMDRSMSIL